MVVWFILSVTEPSWIKIRDIAITKRVPATKEIYITTCSMVYIFKAIYYKGRVASIGGDPVAFFLFSPTH